MNSDNRILATYVTYKKLYVNRETDVYDIISEFVKYVVLKEHKTSYSQVELLNLVKDNFDFKIPSLVLKPAATRIKGITFNNEKKYCVDYSRVKTSENFEQIQAEAFKNNDIIMNDIICYIETKLSKKLDDEERKKVMNSFRRYILDETSSDEYVELISTFIIEKSEDKEYVNKIDYIREGHILYNGLCLNQHISECGWKNKLTIYMDMEILFHLAGYNGTTFQKIAEEFLDLVSEANKTKKYIYLKYFNETKKEIDQFFHTAEVIYQTNQLIKPGHTAMESIVGGCKSVVEIGEKQSKFYYLLQKYNIAEETKTDFYAPKYQTANLESLDFTPEELENVRLISHINKLRNNQVFEDYAFAEYILLSETRTVLEFSRKFISEKEEELRKISGDPDKRLVPYAVNLYTLTNTLWYRLNKSLNCIGEPTTVNSVIRAQIVLAKYINDSIVTEYESLVEKKNRNAIDDKELMFTIMGLRQRSKKPENIIREGVEDAISFLCEKEIDKFAEDYQSELAEHKQVKRNYEKAQSDVANLKNDMKKLIKEGHYNTALYEYNDAKKDLKYISGLKREYADNYEIQQNKAKNNKKLKIKVTVGLYVAFYSGLIALILILKWDIMEPITYILGIPPVIYGFISKHYKTNWSLDYWINSYERCAEYLKAKEKLDIYEAKEATQQLIVQQKHAYLKSIDFEE